MKRLDIVGNCVAVRVWDRVASRVSDHARDRVLSHVWDGVSNRVAEKAEMKRFFAEKIE